jgi:hypothetical protein
LDKDQARRSFEQIVYSDTAILIGQNIAFDVIVMAHDFAQRGVDMMPTIFAMYEQGRVYDVGIAEMLHAIAQGHLMQDPRTGRDLRDPNTGQYGVGYRLSVILDLVLGRTDAKANDRFRMSYALLENVPIEEWPIEARTYPIDDAENTLDIALAQVNGRNRNLHEMQRQAYTALCLALGGAHGFRVDAQAVEDLEAKAKAARAARLPYFIERGLYQVDATGKPKLSPTTGNEMKNTTFIKKRMADAYQLSGVCDQCDGSGKVPGTVKHKECDGVGCVTCGDGRVINMRRCLECKGKEGGCADCSWHPEGKIINPRSMKNCKRCDSTGFDLDSAPIPRTDSDGIATGRDELSESGDELLIDFSEFLADAKHLTTYIPWLRKGLGNSGEQIPLTLRPNVLLATGRVSYSGVVQLLPRGGGIREAVVARPGHVLISSDFSALELVTHAQSCIDILGWSHLADVLNTGADAHSKLGAEMIGVPYEEVLAGKNTGDPYMIGVRTAAKAGNFTFPGGGGEVTFVLAKRKEDFTTKAPDGTEYKGVRFCLLMGGDEVCGHTKVTQWGRRHMAPTCKRCIECAAIIRSSWFKAYPENRQYLRHIENLIENVGELRQHRSNRIRGGLSYCSAANSYFQGLGADATKLALRRVVYEQFCVRSSPLYGSRFILMAHDELILEVREDRLHEAAKRLESIMVQSLQEFCPDLASACAAEPAAMKRWYKGAEPVFNSEGRLIPWEPS